MSTPDPAQVPVASPVALGLARWAALLGRDLQRAARAAGGPCALWRAPAPHIERILRIPPERAAELVALRRGLDVAAERASLAAAGIDHLDPRDGRWPGALGDLPDPPFGLFVASDDPPAALAALAEGPVVAVVGSRRASSPAIALARSLAAGLAERGALVVSGLAHGVDAAAHLGALDAGGRTVAVLGCGVDISYPRRNRALAARVRGSGALLSEFWPGTPPAPWRFPARNRIVAGLSHAVAVVEAGARSGALITADFALELGRPVLAVPGWPGLAGSAGGNGLLRAGAALLECLEDVVDEVDHPGWRPSHTAAGTSVPDGVGADILAHLGREPATPDALVERLGAPASEVARSLALLEVDGLVIRGEGGRFWAAPAPAP
ncbi:MAG: DNA-processing protein DprA [Miltoncostaeaceae bacterium]